MVRTLGTTPKEWFYGPNEEAFVGRAETKEAAIAAVEEEFEFGFVCEANQWLVSLGSLILPRDVMAMHDAFEQAWEDDDNLYELFYNEDGDFASQIPALTDAMLKELLDELHAVADKWQVRHRLELKSYAFAQTGPTELVNVRPSGEPIGDGTPVDMDLINTIGDNVK